MAAQKGKQASKKDMAKWANSKKAKNAIEKAFKRSEKSIEYLREARRIDPETLTKPITM